MAHVSFKTTEVDGGMSRWSEYLSAEEPIPSALASWRNMGVDGPQGSSAGSQKHLQMEPVVQLSKVAEGLLAKMYRLNGILDYPDPNTHTFSDAFWKAGVFPNFPKICITLSKKFPEHPNKLQLERVDKFALDALNENAEGYMHNLEQWILRGAAPARARPLSPPLPRSPGRCRRRRSRRRGKHRSARARQSRIFPRCCRSWRSWARGRGWGVARAQPEAGLQALRQAHREYKLYFMDARYYDVFATVGGNRVTTYRCLENGSFALLQAYIDEDKDDESFYTLSWARDHVDGSPLLVAAGSSGIIRVINCATEKLAKDESVRLWNVHRGICILIFAGAGGHRNEVLSVDFHPSDINRFASCGMDHTVKIWSMKEFWPYVDKSYSWIDLPSKFPTKYVQFPVLIAAVHSNYVDCTRWLADFILSKKYPVPECDIWFIKFSRDFHFNQLAIAQSLALARMAPYRDGMKWTIQAPKTEARPTARRCQID